MKIGIVTDSTACLNKLRAIKDNIKIAYLNVIIGDKIFKENLDITNEEVFNYVENGEKITTSQPTPKEFLDLYEELKNDGYTDIISIHLSSGVSGTFQSANIASSMIDDINIHLFDSESSAFEEEIYIDKAMDMIKEGLAPNKIIEKLNYLRSQSNIYITIDDLSTLVRGGRLSKTQAILGNIIQLKPVISLEDGKLKLVDKIRTKKRVVKKIIEDIKKDYTEKGNLLVHLTHINSTDIVYLIQEKIKDISTDINVKICEEIGPVLSVHFGKGGFGVAWTVDQ